MTEPRSGARVNAMPAVPTEHTEGVEPTGHFRIYLGAAAGVGKTYAMLNEGHRRKRRGTDVVIAFVECHGRHLTEDLIADLEVVPRKTVDYRGTNFEEMDLDAVLQRHLNWRSSTSWLTPTSRDRATTRSVGRMSWRFWRRGSTSSQR